ncbi:MAG TPA: MarR family winged helix-turn-helix transcriptional regulator [Segeticoccus sp.]|uniref:MarR family winged helix-turn-helix transcriptional regulator n=1 Tax=Segeticoccus sp. TaxID=2706531 RepID=UPI002D7F193D|nr:MarR family winged helix-turn-helix transcriptional regulator [Segeticoccus sp.]HET8602005.1 MarR family winged helix-turn-helix transcriptional regulator [Segeticoccus sp.]
MATAPTGESAELRAALLAGQRFRQAVADHVGLSLSATVALGHLADAGGRLSPGELAERMLVRSGTLTAVIDRLARAGHVERRPQQQDRRRVLVVLTPSGRRVAAYAQQHMERALTAAQTTPASRRWLATLAQALNEEADRVQGRSSVGAPSPHRGRAGS